MIFTKLRRKAKRMKKRHKPLTAQTDRRIQFIRRSKNKTEQWLTRRSHDWPIANGANSARAPNASINSNMSVWPIAMSSAYAIRATWLTFLALPSPNRWNLIKDMNLLGFRNSIHRFVRCYCTNARISQDSIPQLHHCTKHLYTHACPTWLSMIFHSGDATLSILEM